MKIKQVVDAGKMTSSYLSSYRNDLQLVVEGGHELNITIPENELRDLANRINERIESIDKEREEELASKLKAEVDEFEDSDG
jgi:hypothetical protein